MLSSDHFRQIILNSDKLFQRRFSFSCNKLHPVEAIFLTDQIWDTFHKAGRDIFCNFGKGP